MAHDVFISYSTVDKAVADAVCATLENRKIRCWIAPRDVTPGILYAESLIDGLNRSRIVVLIFSSNSNNSQQVMREVERAVNKGIPIIPLRIQDVTPTKSMEYFLSAPHWLDALTPPLEIHLQKLADTVQTLLMGEDINQPRQETDTHVQKEASLIASAGIQQNMAGLLCYVLWWVSGIVFLILEKQNRFIRFHAIQSIITFGAISVVEIILRYIPFVGSILQWILGVVALALWIDLMYKAYQGQRYKLPWAGDIADRQSKPTT